MTGCADKTGTLTKGEPSVADLKFCGPVRKGSHRWSEQAESSVTSENDMLVLAAAVEEASMHPLAKAVVAARDQRNLPKRLLEDGSLLQVRILLCISYQQNHSHNLCTSPSGALCRV
jgi:Zn2+/Cd2+-exporting ATPase